MNANVKGMESMNLDEMTNRGIISKSCYIYKTKDYGIFERIESNRDVETVKAVKESIEKYGYLRAPILVNEKFEIIDGQHRLEACSQLGIAVEFMVQRGLGAKECAALNIGQVNWKPKDWIHHYSKEGNENYCFLGKFLEKYEKETRSREVLMNISTGDPFFAGSGGVLSKQLREGKYIFTKAMYEDSCKIMDTFINLGFVEYCNDRKLYKRVYYTSLLYVYLSDGVNMRRLIKKMKENPSKIISTNKQAELLGMFDDVYNIKLQKENKIFMRGAYNVGKLYKPM